MSPLHTWFVRLLLLAAATSQAPSLSAQPLDPIEESRKAIKRAERLKKSGYVVAACKELGEAALIAPEWWYPVVARTGCPDQSADAGRLLVRALKKEPNPYSLHIALAHLFMDRKDPAAATPHFQSALLQDQTNPTLLWELSTALLAQDRRASAMEVLTRAIEAHPASTLFLVRFAKTAESLGRLELAEWGYRNLAAQGVNPRRNLRVLADFYKRSGCSADAAWVAGLLAKKRPLSPDFRPSEGCAKFLGTP